MDINWSTDHTKDKLPFSYEIVEVIDSKKVNIKIHLTDKCINHFVFPFGNIYYIFGFNYTSASLP